jgi:pentatricopeptide repeat protein
MPPIHPPLYAPPPQVGRLWTSLADYYIRRGMFEKARDVYEEGLNAVVTVHDFSLIFDACTQARGGGGWVWRGLRRAGQGGR